MAHRIILVGAVMGALLLWLGPFTVPNWVLIGFVFLVLFPLAAALSVQRMRVEGRLAQTLWRALTRR